MEEVLDLVDLSNFFVIEDQLVSRLYSFVACLFFSVSNCYAQEVRWDHFWIWEDTLNNQEAVYGLIHGYEAVLGVSVGAVIIDSPWAESYNNFVFDRERYPEFRKMLADIRAKNIGLVGWLTPYINREGLRHDKFESFKEFSFENRVFKWWKGEGFLIDFRKSNAYENFFYQENSQLTHFDALKVDAVAQFQPYKDWVQTSLNWSKAVGRFARENNLKVMQRGVSHQGGLQSYPDFVDWNWGGDYSGTKEDGYRQINDLCQSISFGFDSPAFEVGGYNPPAASEGVMYMQLLIASIFPVAILGGKNWEYYFDLIKSSERLKVAIKRKEQLAELFNEKDIISCRPGYLSRNNIYAVYEQASIPEHLIDLSSGVIYERGYQLGPGIYIPLNKWFCPRDTAPFENMEFLGQVKKSREAKCFSHTGWR